MKNFGRLLFVCLWAPSAQAGADITIRRAPHVVSTVSSKTERARVPCRFCSSSVSYERTYRWDVYKHVWRETTRPEDVPESCRKCRSRLKEQEKLDRRERELDRRIAEQESRARIRAKERRLRRLRRNNR